MLIRFLFSLDDALRSIATPPKIRIKKLIIGLNILFKKRRFLK
jgi:hypothetical protein